ncbi:MAG: hypothetical protein U5N27_24330 [Rhizobium sp.]|nr:hypothetical protein [Rhizobium sp.]
MAIAALGFVSVGVHPPTPELGSLMIELLPYFIREAPHALLPSIAIIFLIVLALQLIGGKDKP